MDDFLTAAAEDKCIDNFVNNLSENLKLKSDSPSCFLCLEITLDNGNIYLQQKNYVLKLLERFKMDECNASPTPKALGQTFDESDSEKADLKFFQR